MADLGKAYVEIVPSAKGIRAKLEKELGSGVGSGSEKAGANLGGKLLSGLKTVFAAADVGKIVKDAFAAGGDLQQSFGGLDTIYGDAAAGAKEYAAQAAQMGISANEYAEQAVSFGAALKAAYGGDTAAAMEAANVAIMDMADNSAKMGTDIGSVQAAYQGFAKQNYTMLDNLKLGYGGTKAEMERLLADAQKLTGVEYNIDNLGDVYNAIHAIQEDLGLTGVAAEEAKTTLTGSFGAVKASWTNFMAALTTGEGLEAAMANLSESVSNFGNVVLSMLGNILPQIPTFVQGFASMIAENAPELLASGAEMIVQLAVGFVNQIPDIVAKIPELWAAVKEAFSGVDWPSLGKDLIDGIIRGLDAALTGLWNAVSDLAKGALNKAREVLQIGSPSKVFANEVGQWIPAGVALGIDENDEPISASIEGMAAGATADFARMTAAGSTYTGADAAPAMQRPAAQSGGMRTAIFNINGREFARAIFEDQQQVADDHGFSLIVT